MNEQCKVDSSEKNFSKQQKPLKASSSKRFSSPSSNQIQTPRLESSASFVLKFKSDAAGDASQIAFHFAVIEGTLDCLLEIIKWQLPRLNPIDIEEKLKKKRRRKCLKCCS